MSNTPLPEDFFERPTTPCPPPPDPLRHVRDSLRPPRTPSDLGPYSRARLTWGEIGLLVIVIAGACSAVFVGFEWSRYWEIGGWIGVVWFGVLFFAAGLVGAAIASVVALREIRR